MAVHRATHIKVLVEGASAERLPRSCMSWRTTSMSLFVPNLLACFWLATTVASVTMELVCR